MINGFFKLSTDFKFDFDIDNMISKIGGDLSDPNESNIHPKVYHSPTGELHWQRFLPSDIRFARNVYRNLTKECDSIANNLILLKYHVRRTMINSNSLLDRFLKHNVNSDRIGIIKQQRGCTVLAHRDSTRSLTLNIGLKNSNTGRTCVGDQSYVMQDHDVYLLNTSLTHSVESLSTECDRYIISYTVDY